jgi:hypothetical protein
VNRLWTEEDEAGFGTGPESLWAHVRIGDGWATGVTKDGATVSIKNRHGHGGRVGGLAYWIGADAMDAWIKDRTGS